MLGIGSIIGAAGNFATQNNNREASHSAIGNAKGTLAGTAGYADEMKAKGQQILEQMLNGTNGIYGTSEDAAAALADARDAVNGLDGYEASEFNYNKDVGDFYDKALGIRMNAANDAINQSQALGGNLFSSDTADKLTAQAQVLGSQAYNDAMQAYTADKTLEQGIWQGNEASKQAAVNSGANLANMKYGMANDTASNLSAANDAYYNALIQLNDDYYQNKTDYASQIAALEAQDPGTRGWFQRTFDPAGFFM